MLVLNWTGTWWSRVDNEKVKEGKRLIFPGLHNRLSHSRESARNMYIYIYIEGERKRKRKSATVSTVSPSVCHEVMGPDAMILVF